MRLEVVIPPENEPVELDEARRFCRIDSDLTEEDALLTTFITAAREQVEVMTGRALAPQTLRMTLDSAPRERSVMLPRVPLIEVEDVTFAGEMVEGWTVTTTSVPAVLSYPHAWPAGEMGITFRCGYGAEETEACPERARQALLFLVSHWYEERLPVVVGRTATSVPMTVDSLISPLKTWVWR